MLPHGGFTIHREATDSGSVIKLSAQTTIPTLLVGLAWRTGLNRYLWPVLNYQRGLMSYRGTTRNSRQQVILQAHQKFSSCAKDCLPKVWCLLVLILESVRQLLQRAEPAQNSTFWNMIEASCHPFIMLIVVYYLHNAMSKLICLLLSHYCLQTLQCNVIITWRVHCCLSRCHLISWLREKKVLPKYFLVIV